MVRKRRINQVIFLVVMVSSLIPLFLFFLHSVQPRHFLPFPALEDGVLDLTGYDLSQKQGIPLNGVWEVFPNRWIVSEGGDRSGGQPSQVPRRGSATDGIDWAQVTFSSYRITLKNCPGDQWLLCSVPSIYANYQIFLNGTCIASRGVMDRHAGASVPVAPEQMLQRHGVSVPAGSDAELVIELLTPQVSGLYMTPILTEQSFAHTFGDQRTTTEAIFIGLILAALFFIICLQTLPDNLLSSFSLLLLDFLVFLRILIRNGHLVFLETMTPVGSYSLNLLFHCISLFLPVILLLCVRKLLHQRISRRAFVCIVSFELLLLLFSLGLAPADRANLAQLICVLSFLPFFYVGSVLYQSVSRGAPYSLLVSSALGLSVSAIAAMSLDFSGWLITQLSLYPPAVFALSMLVQLWISIRYTLDLQKRAMEAEQLRLQLRESDLNLRLSQIKPHFLYNTLLAIHVLCTEAPETAAETTLKFASFLRTNMNFIDAKDLIPFEKELTHVQNYTDIELLRFQRRLTVRFDIQATDFSVPPLSIQPLVENAIRHGACKNVRGGTVTLSTRTEEGGFLVEIADDGPGFVPNAVLQSAESTHGLPNVLYRLGKQQGVWVDIQSAPGAGTRILIHLAKEDPS